MHGKNGEPLLELRNCEDEGTLAKRIDVEPKR